MSQCTIRNYFILGFRPSPAPRTTIELGFLGSVLHVELPGDVDEQQLGTSEQPQPRIDQDWHVRPKCKFPSHLGVIIRIQLLAGSPPLAAPSAIHIFEASLSHLWSIWECLVLCESILIFGQSPAWTSKAIWWMRDVFRPVRTFFVSDS